MRWTCAERTVELGEHFNVCKDCIVCREFGALTEFPVIPFGKMIYFASPYSHPDKSVVSERFVSVVKACGWLMVNVPEVQMFYSPIAHTHPIAEYSTLPGGWEYWMTCDKTILSRCSEIWVYCISGWTKSVGVNAERKIAAEYGLGVKFVI